MSGSARPISRSIPLLSTLILVLAGACGEPERQSTGTELARTVESYIDAVGGRQRLESLSVIHTIDSLYAGGLAGTSESWWTRDPFRGRNTVVLGPVTQDVLFLGDTAWTIDRNGHLAPGDQQTVAQGRLARATIFYEAFLQGDSLRLLADTVVAGEAVSPIAIEGDLPLILYISRTSGLPVMIESKTMGMEVRQYPSGYELVDGIRSAMVTVDSIPAVGFVVESRNILTEYDIAVSDSVFLLSPASLDWELEQTGAGYPFRLRGQHIYLNGTVGDTTVTVLLDSGAGATIIDSALAEAQGFEGSGEFIAQGAQGREMFSFVTVPEYRVAGATVHDQSLAVLNTSGTFYGGTGERIGMILGYDFLSRFVTRLDYGERTISLYPPADFAYEGDGSVIEAQRTVGLLSVPCTLEDSLEMRLLLDTGAGGALHLLAGFLERNPGLLSDRPALQVSMEGVGGSYEATVFRAGNLRIGDFDVPAGLSSTLEGSPALQSFDGILGAAVLARFVVYLDYERERIILEASTLFDRGLPEDLTGLGLQIIDGRVIIEEVVAGSPAEAAGVTAGDILLEIGGEEAGPELVGNLGGIAPAEGDTLVMRVERDGEPLRLELVTARLL